MQRVGNGGLKQKDLAKKKRKVVVAVEVGYDPYG
jgi:hypothetical protein